uniref:BHLH domain-containing protein n=1 Tax=Salix viminalis TaxID=40686 RepID=A0A6N2M8C6_SALVM
MESFAPLPAKKITTELPEQHNPFTDAAGAVHRKPLNSLNYQFFCINHSSPGKGNQNQDEEEYEEDEFSSRKDGPSSSFTVNNNNSSKDGKSNDKANAIRSKHSVTEQRRRSKINERFQILRDIVPHSDQKRDTASFLLEVIEYVQYLQQKVQKYEGPYQGWSSEPAKLMPWKQPLAPSKFWQSPSSY